MRNIILFITILAFTSCATYKTDSKGVTNKDYNGRLWVDDAHYNNRTNAIGYGTMVAAAAAGGYVAYEYGDGIINYYDKGERKDLKVADAALGAFTAFTVTYIVNKYISKPATIKTDIDPQKWMKDARIDDQYNLLKTNYNDLTLIDKSYESRFIVKNYKDIKDFETAFPNSPYLNDVLKAAIKKIDRTELYSLIKKYPHARDIKSMQLEYIKTSPNLAAFFKGYYEFPNIGFSNKTVYINRLVEKASRGDLPTIISKYASDSDIDILKKAYFDRSSTLLDLYKAQKKYTKYTYANFDKKVKSLLPTAKRYTLKDIVKNYPQDKNFTIYKTTFIDKSSNLSELLEAKKLFSSIPYNYDKKALTLLEELDDLPIYKSIVTSKGLLAGQRKIDKKLWKTATKENTFASYATYIYQAPLKLYRKEASIAMDRIKTSLKSDLRNLIKNKDILGTYNYYLQHKDAKDSFTKNLAELAYKGSIALTNANVEAFNRAVEYDSPNQALVKIILSSNDKRPLFPDQKKITKFLDTRYSESYHLGVMFGMSPKKNKLFHEIYKPQFYNNMIVINALWYRKGTEKDGDWLTQNSGFAAFRKTLSEFANSHNLSVEYLEYLGSYSDDYARNEARMAAREAFRQEQCNNCIVDYSKTERPDNEGFFTSNGIIYMKNGDHYSYNIDSDGKPYIPGFIFNDNFDSWNEFISHLTEICENNNCR